jgi:hypothetical protein
VVRTILEKPSQYRYCGTSHHPRGAARHNPSSAERGVFLQSCGFATDTSQVEFCHKLALEWQKRNVWTSPRKPFKFPTVPRSLRRWIGSGDSPGLQNQRVPAFAGIGGFDSHAPPPATLPKLHLSCCPRHKPRRNRKNGRFHFPSNL